MIVIADPPSYTRTGNGTQSSITITATMTGGTAPYTYLWQAPYGGPVTIDSPTTAGTTFTVIVNPTDYIIEPFNCTVTDSATNSATSNDVTIIFQGSS